MKDPGMVIDLHTENVCSRYAILKNISQDKAIEIFLSSKTYEALLDIETGLCYEMTDYIYEMFLEEGDTNELQAVN